jgi:hypothetical protein
MSTIGCNEFLLQLESWMEGNRQPGAETHVRGCRECRNLLSDIEAIHSTARSWDAAEPSEPPARIWASLRLQLEAEGLIHDRGGRDHASYDYATEVRHAGIIPAIEHQSPANLEHRAGWFEKVFAGMARPALAGAYLVALIAAGFALSGLGSQRGTDDRWADVTQNATSPLNSELETVEHTVTSLSASDPIVTASLHKNLAIVDNYIVLCEKSVHEEPGNEVARDYLYGAYQQKADLLAQMTENGDGR